MSAGQYKPHAGDDVPDEDPAALIREVTALEREIQDGLEKLLADVESTT